MQAFVDPAMMKTCRRVVWCQCSLLSLFRLMMMREMMMIPAERTNSFFLGRPDPDYIKEAVTNFFYGMEVQERSGFKHRDRFLGHLPLPVAKGLPKTRSNRKGSHRRNYSCTDMHWSTGTGLYSVYTNDNLVHTKYILQYAF